MTNFSQTLLAVVVGAILAAAGGFAATQLGIWLDRSRREREAALLGGEILATVGILLRLAEEVALAGTLLDPLSSRFLTAARSEIDVYERNRELLFSLRDADLRARLHSFVIRLSIPLDRLADGNVKHAELCRGGQPPSPQAAALRKEMEVTFAYLMSSRPLIPELLALLQPIARTKFDSYGNIDKDGLPMARP